METTKRFYTYAYLREDGSPYYIGKGSGKRIRNRCKSDIKPPKNKSRTIFLKKDLIEEEAFKHEKYMIAIFGRKDLQTGILHNRTDGGKGGTGYTLERRLKYSEMYMGEKNPNYGNRWNEKQRKKLSEYRMNRYKGEKNPMVGKKRIDLSERNKKPKYWMTNGECDKLILREDYDYYVSLGFWKGRLFANCKRK